MGNTDSNEQHLPGQPTTAGKKQTNFAKNGMEITASDEGPNPLYAKLCNVHLPLSLDAQPVYQRLKNHLPTLSQDIYQLSRPFASYQGSFQNELPFGEGICVFGNGGFFAGQFINGEACCTHGIYIFPDGSLYRGSFRESLFNGYGGLEDRKKKRKYIGNWTNGRPNGEGQEIMISESQLKQRNAFESDDLDISMEQTLEEGLNEPVGDRVLYHGQFKDGKRHGRGILKTTQGFFQGKFIEGYMEGTGLFMWQKRKAYIGEFKRSKKHGKGKIYSKNKFVEGIWKNDSNVSILKKGNTPSGQAMFQRIMLSCKDNLKYSKVTRSTEDELAFIEELDEQQNESKGNTSKITSFKDKRISSIRYSGDQQIESKKTMKKSNALGHSERNPTSQYFLQEDQIQQEKCSKEDSQKNDNNSSKSSKLFISEKSMKKLQRFSQFQE